MKSSPIPTVLSASALAFFIGVCFPVQITPNVSPWYFGDANSTFGCSNILFRFWRPTDNTLAVEGTNSLQENATSEIFEPANPKGKERLPPNIVAAESDLHLRRLWGNPREDTPTRKYLLAMTIGYNEKANVNATVQKVRTKLVIEEEVILNLSIYISPGLWWPCKLSNALKQFSSNFDVVLFHYDGRTTEWEEFEWSKKAVHVSARGQTKWWYAKRFLHPSIVAPYDYIFLWDEDLGVEAFDAEEYVKILRKHGLEISQPGLDTTRGSKPFFDITVRRDGTEVHKSTLRSPEAKCTRRPCSGFVEVMAPVFSREAWTCVWHMIQNDLVHGHGLDWDFWRCVDDPSEQIGVVDAQYVAHHAVVTLGTKGGSRGNVTARQKAEFNIYKTRMRLAAKAQAAALLAAPVAAS